MITAERFQEIALTFTSTAAVPHMERLAFRTPKRIFATLAKDGASANVLLSLELQELLSLARKGVFAPVAGGWGPMGWTRCDLALATEADVNDALAAAHKGASAAPTKKKASTKKHPNS
jgi:hypothetical protein